MIKSDIPYINYILDIIKDIEKSISNISKNNFEKNKDKKEANVKRFEIISEVINNVSAKLKKKYSNIEWKKFEGIKERLSHKYFGIDTNTILELIKKDIPELKNKLQKIKKDLEETKK